MNVKKTCKQCGTTYSANRADSEFCSGRCCAKWYRENATSEAAFHAARERHHVYTCEECGDEFWVNDYGKRGGARAPRFCSTRCRVRNHRAVHAEMGAQEGWKDANENRKRPPSEKAKQQQQQRERERQQQQQRERQQRERQQRSSSSSSKSHSFWKVLGVAEFAPFDECKRAWKELIKRYHPDVYKGEDATERAQEINAAFDYVKTYWGRK